MTHGLNVAYSRTNDINSQKIVQHILFMFLKFIIPCAGLMSSCVISRRGFQRLKLFSSTALTLSSASGSHGRAVSPALIGIHNNLPSIFNG